MAASPAHAQHCGLTYATRSVEMIAVFHNYLARIGAWVTVTLGWPLVCSEDGAYPHQQQPWRISPTGPFLGLAGQPQSYGEWTVSGETLVLVDIPHVPRSVPYEEPEPIVAAPSAGPATPRIWRDDISDFMSRCCLVSLRCPFEAVCGNGRDILGTIHAATQWVWSHALHIANTMITITFLIAVLSWFAGCHVLFKILARFVVSRRNAANARALKCEEPSFERNRWPLGIDNLMRTLAADRNQRFPEDLIERFDALKTTTYRYEILGA